MCRNEFNAMLARHGMTKAELAEKLGITVDKLYRRLRNGNFYITEVDKMREIFSDEEVMCVFFGIK